MSKPFTPRAGSIADRVIRYLKAHGDCGFTSVHLVEMLRLEISPYALNACLQPARNGGALDYVAGEGPARQWFLGNNVPEYPADADEDDLKPLHPVPAMPNPGVRSIFSLAQAQVATSHDGDAVVQNSVSQSSEPRDSEGLAVVAEGNAPSACAAVAGEGAADAPHEPAAAAPVKSLPTSGHYAFGLFSDGRLVIEHDRAGALTLPAEATRQLVDFLDRMLATEAA